MCSSDLYVFALTHNSLFNTSDSYSKSVRVLKLVSVPLSSLLLDIGHLRKVSRRPSRKALRWDKVITIGRVCIVQYRIIFSFHLANRNYEPDPG